MYREPSPTPDLERRIERLEERDAVETRSSLGRWLFLTVVAICVATFAVGASAAIWRGCTETSAETQRRCREICRLHNMRVMWIEGDGLTPGDVCVCGRDSMDGGVIESYSSFDGDARRPQQ